MEQPSNALPHGWIGSRVQNIRRIRDSGQIDYPTISLFFGRNSSGKTSLLRAPLLLKQALESVEGNEAVLSGRFVDFGSYKDAVTDGLVSRDIEISATFGPPRGFSRAALRRIDPLLQPLFRGMRVDTRIHWNQRAGQPQYRRIAFTALDSDTATVELLRTGPESFRVSVGSVLTYTVELPLSPTATRFMDLPPKEGDDGVFALSFGLYYLSQAFHQGITDIIHIGPLREEPQRSYRTELGLSRAQADSAVAILRSGDGIDTIQRSLKRLGMAEDIKVQKLAPGFVAISLHSADSGRIDNLADVGFGVSQVLPILATLATAAPQSTVLIEQPELHLHPEAQGALADVLVELAQERRLRLVVETHSEHMLLRLQRRIAEEGGLKSSDVAIYFIDQGEVSYAAIDENGQIDSRAMPTGFFDEDWQDLMHLAAAAAKRKRA